MGAKLDVKEVIHFLQQHRANLRCDEVKKQLMKLGFEISDRKRGGHKLVKHNGLESFRSLSFNCGHGTNPEIKPAYIDNIVTILNQYFEDIESYMEKRNDRS